MEKAKHKMKYRFEQLATSSGTVHKLYVYDEIRAQGNFNWEEWRYEESETSAKYFRKLLDEIPNGEIIELHVNSVGGEVGEGVTIYNLLVQKKKAGCKLVGYVDGMAYSVAMDIIMACDEIHMGLGTSMFLHNPWTRCQGNADQLRAMADQLDALADASLQLYMSRAKNLEEDVLREMMKKETMLAPNSCMEYGFCDFVGEADPNMDPDPGGEPREDPPDPDDDDPRDQKIMELQQQLFQQREINQMLQGLQRKPSMQDTLAAAFSQMAAIEK
ncbi:MAG: Clp protease ClpP [Lachnospiraceae bacterium]|nr:Clp protease ClpP [Lachnospiraceae bacterium]